MQAERITSIRKIGLVECGDLEVKSKDHLFYGNGIATSNSHSYAYAIDGYWSAWLKAHYPVTFFCAWLKNSDDKPNKQQEIMELVNEAKLFDIDVNLPDIANLNQRFDIVDGHISFGLCDIKGFGDALYSKFKSVVEADNIDLKSLTWYKFLTKISGKINSSGVVGLIKAGALPYNEDRNRMLYEFSKWNELTAREQTYCCTTLATNLIEALNFLVNSNVPNKKRKIIIEGLYNSLVNPPMSLKDNNSWIAINESLYLGTPISCHMVDGYDLSTNTVTCRELIEGREGKVFLLAEVKSKRVTKTKNGKNPGQEMAFLTLEDGTGLLDNVVIFSKAYAKSGSKLIEDAVVLLSGQLDVKKSFIVDNVWEA